jgi:sigma-B regulation protein RsbU (phosphoserine phosphatase)
MLHRALRRQPPGVDLCTVCLVMMTPTPERALLTVALAGHPPPLLIDPSGEAKQIGQTGTLLGVLDPIDITEQHAELLPGETLLLYTDGVPDAGLRADELLGEQGLIELCRQSPTMTLGQLLEHVEHTALERAHGGLRDDLALLGLHLLDRDSPRR